MNVMTEGRTASGAATPAPGGRAQIHAPTYEGDFVLDEPLLLESGRTLTGVTLHVVFKNDEAMPPQIEIAPLSLIRTHEPYVDIEPVSAAPLAPGADREFRLTFENINSNWNQQAPDIHISGLVTR